MNMNEQSKLNEYSMIKYKPQLFSKVMKMFNDSAGKGFEKTTQYFRYNLSQTPYGKPIRFLMMHKGSVVGSVASRPLLFKVKNRFYLGGYLYNTRTHHEHRKKGIFLALEKKLFEETKKKKYNFLITFSNENSFPPRKEKLGMQEIPINYIKIKKTNFIEKKTAKVLDHYFPRNLYRLYDKYKIEKDFPIRIQRDEKYFLWRYKKNPEYRYLTCYEKGEYFFIFKKYRDSLHIVDFLVSSKSHYDILINTAKKIAKDLACNEVNMWIPKSHPIFNYLDKNSITNLEPKQRLQVLVFKKTLEPLMYDLKNWYFTMGDSNVF